MKRIVLITIIALIMSSCHKEEFVTPASDYTGTYTGTLRDYDNQPSSLFKAEIVENMIMSFTIYVGNTNFVLAEGHNFMIGEDGKFSGKIVVVGRQVLSLDGTVVPKYNNMSGNYIYRSPSVLISESTFSGTRIKQ